jgi:hypothetical protein
MIPLLCLSRRVIGVHAVRTAENRSKGECR